MLFAYSRHFCGPVEDRDKVWVEAGAAAYAAILWAEEEDTCAQTLRTCG